MKIRKTLWMVITLSLLSSVCLSKSNELRSPLLHEGPSFIENNLQLNSISCDLNGQQCTAVGFLSDTDFTQSATYKTNDGGQTWQQGIPLNLPFNEENAFLPDKLMQINCSKSNRSQNCLIASVSKNLGQFYLTLYISHDRGTSWSEPKLVPLAETKNHADDRFVRFSCDDLNLRCFLFVGLDSPESNQLFFYSTEDGGENWHERSILPMISSENKPINPNIFDITCNQNGLRCKMVGSSSHLEHNDSKMKPLLLTTEDGGITWEQYEPFFNAASINPDYEEPNTLFSLFCDPYGSNCVFLASAAKDTEDGDVASYNYALYTHDGGHSFNHLELINPDNPTHLLFSIRCNPNLSWCAAFGFDDDNENNVLKSILYHQSPLAPNPKWIPADLVPSPSEPHSNKFIMDIFCNEDASICHLIGLNFLDEME